MSKKLFPLLFMIGLCKDPRLEHVLKVDPNFPELLVLSKPFNVRVEFYLDNVCIPISLIRDNKLST